MKHALLMFNKSMVGFEINNNNNNIVLIHVCSFITIYVHVS